MRLRRVALGGFQSYANEQTVDIDENITLLAGQNNVGKSAFLRALQIPISRQEGIAPDCSLKFTWSVSLEDINASVGLTEESGNWMRQGGDPQLLIVSYRVFGDGDGTAGAGSLKLWTLEVPSLPATVSGGKEVWDNEELRTGDNQGAFTAYKDLADAAMKRVLYLAPRRVELGQRQFNHSTELAADARNLPDVLLDLYLGDRYGKLREVEELMQTAFPGVRGIGFPAVTTPASATDLKGEPVIYFQDREESVPLRLCGTGLEQMLALAVGLLTATGSLMVLIDEPQAYLHPHAERALIGLLQAHTEHQFIVATHSHALLSSQPLGRARLMSLEGGATRVADVRDEQQLLENLGVTAADLWLVDRLLWVEGPSDQRIFEMLAAAQLSHAERSTLAIRHMPEASRFAAKSPQQAAAAYDFCSTVARAVAPTSVRMLFVFDSDGKSDEFQARLQSASDGRTAFLDMREIENCFLDSVLIHEALASLCRQAGIPIPDPTRVDEYLEELLADVNDRELYPQDVPEGRSLRDVVHASRLLGRIWWELASASYDKVLDGERLTRAALAGDSARLSQLIDILHQLIAD